ncbi:MAG TPA: hypothetical protein VMK13_12945 [Streptosporangiaceae bacterium]|nr:hypothetical protein [Streptosporangiaceae bacterium]
MVAPGPGNTRLRSARQELGLRSQQVAERDPELACSHAEAALDSLARFWYATGMDRVRAVRQALTQWESLPCVRRLDERLYAWNSTVRALTG